jgi:ribose transport system ATP-binding protein
MGHSGPGLARCTEESGLEDIILKLEGVTKVFPGVTALDNVSISFRRGEVHAIVGENGAGKSTLIKIISGAYTPTSGHMELNGVPVPHHYTPHQAIAMGISVIYQEFNLVPALSVAENIFFGRELAQGGFLDKKTMNAEAARLFSEMGVEVDVRTPAKRLSVAYQQITEIVKAVSRNAAIMIMDEPTAPLTNRETEALFQVVRRLKARGMTIIYISHRLEEIFDLCDRVTVLRDGMHVRTCDVAETRRNDLIRQMIGRELTDTYPLRRSEPGEIVLCVEGFSSGKVQGVSFDLRKGEILGFGGLVGSGRTELMRALFGADRKLDGRITLRGTEARITSPRVAIQHGIGLLPEDRKAHGLVLGLAIRTNITFAILKTVSRFGLLSGPKEKALCDDISAKLRIKATSLGQATRDLSGGNQQKVVIAKWLATRCSILIFDEPTRGIDVGAKQEIYQLMRELAEGGASVIMVSSEMPELLGMSDRIVIMREGRVAGTLARQDFSQERVLEIASTSNRGEAAL